MRKRPLDTFAETGAPGDMSGTAAAAGTESFDPLAAMAPAGGPPGDQQGIAAMLQPSGGSVPTSGPNLGPDLSAAVTNPGDAALSQGMDAGGGGMDPGQDPDMLAAQQMEQQLQDPSLPPDQRAQIMQQLQLAARRRLAGV